MTEQEKPSAVPYRRLKPTKIWMHGLQLSAESERLLDEAMVRLDIHDPDAAIKTALEAF